MRLSNGFSEANNTAFLESKEFIHLPFLRKIFVAFIILYSFFGFTDLVYFPETWRVVFLVRFGFVVPMLFLTLLFTFHKCFVKYAQWVLSICFVIGGLGIAIMLIMLPENMVYYGGLFLVYFSGYLLLHLRFIYATVAGWAIFAFHVIGSLVSGHAITDAFLYGMLFFIGANLIGMFGAYHFEQKNRTQFLHDIRIKEINDEMLAQFDEKTKQYDQLMTSIRKNQELAFKNEEKDRLTHLLKESEEQYKLLTSQMPLGLALHEVIYDAEGKPIDYRFLSVNSSYERLTGLMRNNVIGKTVLEVLPKTEHIWIETYGEVAKTGNTVSFEEYSASLGRHYRVYAYSTKRGLFAVIVEDITERIQFENQLKQREKDLLATQEIAHLGSWRLDVENNQVVWSNELYRIYGFDPTLPPPPYTEHMKLFTPASWDQLRTALALTVEFGIPYDLELETVAMGGKNGWLWAHGEAEKDQFGKILSVWGAAQDITERKKLQAALQESNARYMSLFEQTQNAIEIYNSDGVLLHANEASLRFYGVENKTELIGQRLFDNPHLSPEIIQKIKHQESVVETLDYNFDVIKAKRRYRTLSTGTKRITVSISPLLHDGELYGYVVQSDEIPTV